MSRRVRHFLAVAISLVVLPLCERPATAGTTGAIAGILRDDKTNAPLANAPITVASPSQVAATTTNATGQFSFLTLVPDTYTLRSEKSGYAASEQPGVRVTADQQVNVSMVAAALQRIGGTTVSAPNSLVPYVPTLSTVLQSVATQAAIPFALAIEITLRRP